MEEKKYSILLVDDNPIFIKTFELLLAKVLREKVDCIDTAANGEEGVTCLSNKEYDYVFMDVDMPVLNGIDATWQMNHTNMRNTTIIALTHHQEMEIMQKMILAGARHFIVKSNLNEQVLEKFFK